MFYWHLRLPGVKTSAHLEPHRLDNDRVGTPGVKTSAHLESHPIDSDRVGTPGASGSAYLRVGGFATGCSIGT